MSIYASKYMQISGAKGAEFCRRSAIRGRGFLNDFYRCRPQEIENSNKFQQRSFKLELIDKGNSAINEPVFGLSICRFALQKTRSPIKGLCPSGSKPQR